MSIDMSESTMHLVNKTSCGLQFSPFARSTNEDEQKKNLAHKNAIYVFLFSNQMLMRVPWHSVNSILWLCLSLLLYHSQLTVEKLLRFCFEYWRIYSLFSYFMQNYINFVEQSICHPEMQRKWKRDRERTRIPVVFFEQQPAYIQFFAWFENQSHNSRSTKHNKNEMKRRIHTKKKLLYKYTRCMYVVEQ